MKNIYIVSIVLLLVAVITVYVLQTYNKLILLRNEAEKKHKEIEKLVHERFSLANTYIQVLNRVIDQNTLNTLVTLVNRYNISDKEDVFRYYIDLSSILNSIEVSLINAGIVASPLPEWFDTFHKNAENIEKIRTEYNDISLKINNAISSSPTNIIGKLFGFKKINIFPITQ